MNEKQQFSSSCGILEPGHNRPEIIAALLRFSQKLAADPTNKAAWLPEFLDVVAKYPEILPMFGKMAQGMLAQNPNDATSRRFVESLQKLGMLPVADTSLRAGSRSTQDEPKYGVANGN